MTDRPQLEIRYEDDDVAVISKPAGLVVHPGAGNQRGTLVDQLHEQWPAQGAFDPARAGLLHRLDKDTSGLLMIAKTAAAQEALAAQFKARTIQKRYQTVVHGRLLQPRGVIDAPITRHHADRKKMAVRPDGRRAETRYEVIRDTPDYSLLMVEIVTGRTHQIRVHLAALGHPVIGDTTYGREDDGVARQLLHAAELRFSQPSTGRIVRVADPPPKDMRQFLSAHGLA